MQQRQFLMLKMGRRVTLAEVHTLTYLCSNWKMRRKLTRCDLTVGCRGGLNSCRWGPPLSPSHPLSFRQVYRSESDTCNRGPQGALYERISPNKDNPFCLSYCFRLVIFQIVMMFALVRDFLKEQVITFLLPHHFMPGLLLSSSAENISSNRNKKRKL